MSLRGKCKAVFTPTVGVDATVDALDRFRVHLNFDNSIDAYDLCEWCNGNQRIPSKRQC